MTLELVRPPLDPVRFSRLKLMGQSPLHYQAATVEETLAMERGSAVHSLVLGGQEVVGWEEGRPRRGKDFDAFAADHPDALILTAKAFDEANAIADAVKRNRVAMRALDGDHEIESAWQIGGRECAGRMDVIGAHGVTELKVSQTAKPDRFIWHALRQGWYSQVEWYLNGVKPGGVGRIVAVEPKAPFAVTTFRLSPGTLEKAARTWRLWFEQLLVCEDSDEWPPYAQDEYVLDLPDNDVALDFGDSVEAA